MSMPDRAGESSGSGRAGLSQQPQQQQRQQQSQNGAEGHHHPVNSSSSHVNRGDPYSDPPPYDNPANLTRVYPFATYSPFARVGSHFAQSLFVPPEPTPSASVYPQYADDFRRMDRPATSEDWEYRRQAEIRVHALLSKAGPSYSEEYRHISMPSSDPRTMAQPGHPPLPMAYSFLPSYLPPPPDPDAPPTPAHSTGLPATPPAQKASVKEYFDSLVEKALNKPAPPPLPRASSSSSSSSRSQKKPVPDPLPSSSNPSDRPSPSSSTASTPTVARGVARMQLTPGESPDPLSLPGPSPSKRRKHGSAIDQSPTFRASQLAAGSSTSKRPVQPAVTNGVGFGRMYVEIPNRSPTKAAGIGRAFALQDDDESDDELDWGDSPEEADGDWAMDAGATPTHTGFGGGPHGVRLTGSARTGEKDMRTSLQKMQTLLDDIFEESDAFPADPSQEDIANCRFFTRVSTKGSNHPLISEATMHKLIRYITRVQLGRKKQKAKDGGQGWDEEALKRLFRLLERSLIECEGIDVFPADKAPPATDGERTKKGSKRSKKQQAAVKNGETAIETLGADGKSSQESAESDKLDHDGVMLHEERMAIVRDGVLAAQCVFLILDEEGISKPLYSEDLVSTCVTALKDAMSKVIFPFVEAIAEEKSSSRYLDHVAGLEALSRRSKSTTIQAIISHPTLAAIAQGVHSALPHLSNLISRTDISFSDGVVIQMVYLAISPLFVTDASGPKKRGKESRVGGGLGSVMKGLRTEALGCLRGAFAEYEDQRQWIIEEILGSLVKVPESSSQARFELADGSSIHTISALLIQLIQASAHGVMTRVRRIRAAAVEWEMEVKNKEPINAMEEEVRLCNEAVDSAMRSARVVASYLVQKSSTTKANKSSHDTDYKAVLDTFISDLLTALYRPEWPAAAFFVSVLSKIFVTTVEDPASTHESNAAKNVALDYLGDIATRLREVDVGNGGVALHESVKSLDQVISDADLEAAKAIIGKHKTVKAYLTGAAREDAMYTAALDMATVTWAQELQAAVTKSESVAEKLSTEKGQEPEEARQKLLSIGRLLSSTLRDVWTGDGSLFEISDSRQHDPARQASLAIARGRPLQAAFQPILHALLLSMDLSAVGFRSKALRGLSSVVSVDPGVLGLRNVRSAIEERLSDPSPAVRDAAIELVGKFVVKKPKLAEDYYPQIAARVTDTGLAVRKRVIKLLRTIFATTTSQKIKVDICIKMLGLIGDKDDTVKDLAVKSLVELLYPIGATPDHSAGLLVQILDDHQGSTTELEEALQEVASELRTSGRLTAATDTVDSLIGRLVDATEQQDFDAYTHIKAITLLVAGRPELVDITKATVLLSYLRPPQNAEEQATNDMLLRIFRASIPTMPRTASNFAADLSKALMPMINKPNGGIAALKEIIGCFCIVTSHLTRDFARLISVLRACESKLQMMRRAFLEKAVSPAQPQVASIMLYITALIAENINLDQLALDDSFIQQELAKMTDEPIFEHLYFTYLDFAKMSIPQNATIACLGCLFRSYPALILRDETMAWMDSVFTSNDLDNHARLLGVIHEFMQSEAKKKAEGGGPRDMSALIGSAPELSESGVSTSVLQRNIDHVLQGARSQHGPTQNAAMEVLAFTVNQGLYHPLQCMPILISLETSDDAYLSDRALALHATLHSKHSSLVNVRYLDFARAAYDYQRGMSSEVSGQRDGLALLSGWYTLLGEKRAWRHEFLRSLGRAFDYDAAPGHSIDTGFVLFIADNLATLEYKLQEEVMTVIQQLSQLVSTCAPLASSLENARVEGQAKDDITGRCVVGKDGEGGGRAETMISASIVVCLALLTKNHLIDVYTLSEDKCVKHQPGKKSALGDKPAVRRYVAPLDIARLPLVRGCTTIQDFNQQQATFLQLLHEDGMLDREL